MNNVYFKKNAYESVFQHENNESTKISSIIHLSLTYLQF